MLIHRMVLVSLAVFGASLEAETARFQQRDFCISFFVDPPLGEDAAERYDEIAAANFNVVTGMFGGQSPELVRRQVQLCRERGLKLIAPMAGLADSELPDDPEVWGYFIRDEPSATDFPALRARVDALRAARPGKLGYINLFPSYCELERLGTPTYDEHVRRYMEEVDPDVLCMDHYPFMRRDKDTRDAYLEDLATMRKHAMAKGVPWWNFFNTMPFGAHADPTEAQLRWQIFSSVAFGAKGVLYFCYWTPRGGEFEKGGAIFTAEGRRTRHYEQAKRINAVLKQWGPRLMTLTSESVGRVTGGAAGAATLAGTPLKEMSEGEFELGVFRQPDGRRVVVLVNRDTAYTAWPTLSFDAEEVLEVSGETGQDAVVIDDSPAMPGLQLSFDAGDARMFVLPAPVAAPDPK